MADASKLIRTGSREASPAGQIGFAGRRLASIDAMRGFVMAIMLLDHVRETVFLYQQVGDPVDVSTTSPGLFFIRLLSSVCAPAFVVLTGLSAWLYGQAHSKRETSFFLLKRGAFLIVLELLVVGTAWTGVFPPEKFYLQVIWCIGICMITLAMLIHLPRSVQLFIAIAFIAGHNLLDGIEVAVDSIFHIPWAILHQRDWFSLPGGLIARTSYPVLPWIGVIVLGYVSGPLFAKDANSDWRRKVLLISGAAMLLGFVSIRMLNGYGDHSWAVHDSALVNVMGFLSLTKYPPSLLFLLSTLGVTALGLVYLEKTQAWRPVAALAEFGSAPMFFYIAHLYILKTIYLLAVALFGTNKGEYFGFEYVWQVLLFCVALFYPLYWLTCRFAVFKRRRRDIRWLKYL